MRVGTGRFAVLLAVLALMFAACSQSTASSAPSSSTAVASEQPSESAASSESASPPPPTPLPANESQAKPGDVTIRWYCCLGTGDAPEQVTVEIVESSLMEDRLEVAGRLARLRAAGIRIARIAGLFR